MQSNTGSLDIVRGFGSSKAWGLPDLCKIPRHFHRTLRRRISSNRNQCMRNKTAHRHIHRMIRCYKAYHRFPQPPSNSPRSKNCPWRCMLLCQSTPYLQDIRYYSRSGTILRAPQHKMPRHPQDSYHRKHHVVGQTLILCYWFHSTVCLHLGKWCTGNNPCPWGNPRHSFQSMGTRSSS